jgi:septin family protein
MLAGTIPASNFLADSSCLQSQIRRKKNVKKGIQFCLMVCGASGTGECENTFEVR